MQTWLDRVTMSFAPRWTMKRVRARIATEMLARHYEAASTGRRTQGWRRTSGDANAAVGSAGATLRDQARDLVRNNAHAESALTTIVDHTVGWGIVAAPKKGSAKQAPSNVARELWKAWAETKACDAEGRQDFYGLEAQVMRTVIEAGACLVRRRWRRPEDGLPIPLQLQVLEPDFLDRAKTATLPNGGKIIQGIEFDPIGRCVGYWMFRDHPGATLIGALGAASQRIPATEILHVFKPGRPGAAHGVSWFGNVILRMKDFDEYDDATLMKQKIAACLAVITSDMDGTAPALGTKESTTQPEGDSLEPGMIINAAPGRTVTVVDPPSVSDYDAYTRVQLRTIAAGLGVTYEDLTGDYQGMPFSAARMSRMRHWARVHSWRWRMLIPQFCDPVWAWAMEAAAVMGRLTEQPAAEWTAPPMPILDPVQESTAYQRLVRVGALSWPEMVRERGYDPEAVLTEIAEWNAKFDALGVILDSDPRKTTQQGQAMQPSASASADPTTTTGNGNGASA